MRRALAALALIIAGALPAMAQQTTPAPGLSLQQMQAKGPQVRSAIGAMACPGTGTCAPLSAFLPLLQAAVPSVNNVALDLDTSLVLGSSAALEWRTGQITSGGTLAPFIQARYNLPVSGQGSMASLFTAAGAAVSANGSVAAFPGASGYLDLLPQVSSITAPGSSSSGPVVTSLAGFDASGATLLPNGATAPIPIGSAERGLFFTPQMFSSVSTCTSNGTSGNGNDDTAAIQTGINAAQSTGGTFKIPAHVAGRVCRTTAPLVITAHLTLDGDYCQPYSNTRALTNTPGAGSWLYFDHAGVGISVPADGLGSGATGTATGYTSSVATTGVVLQNFCTYRNQPAYVSGGSWAPNNNDYDISIKQDSSAIRHVMTLNPTRAVYAAGRYVIDDLEGNPYLVGIYTDLAVDVPRILNVHFWPFSTINGPASTYQRANLQALTLGRVDSPMITNFFAISAKTCIHLIQTPAGVTTKIQADNIDCDLYGNTALLSEAPGATGQFTNFVSQGADPEPGASTTASYSAVNLNANNDHMSFHGFRSTNTGGAAVYVTGAGQWVDLTGVFVENWAINGTSGTAAIDAENGATINLDASPLFGPGSVSSTLYSGGSSGTINKATSAKVN